MTPHTDTPNLTGMQRFVLERVAAGATCRQIGRERGCSEVTVRSHSMRLRQRLGAETLPQAVDIAHRLGLLNSTPPSLATTDTDLLTHDEVTVLCLVAIGMTNAAIAQRLHRTPDAVAEQVRRIRHRLGARDRTHAVTLAIVRGLITPNHIATLTEAQQETS